MSPEEQAFREDIAWACGFFDGEGSTSVYRGPWNAAGGTKARLYVRCSLGQKDPRAFDKFLRIVKVGRVQRMIRNGAPFQEWTAGAMADVLYVENLFRFHLGEAKQQQMRRAIEATTAYSGHFKEKT